MPANKIAAAPVQHTNNEKGANVDDELANGPLGKRSCRDVLCCLLFIAFIGGMIGIGSYGYSKGKPTLVGRGYDSNGRMCGVDSGVEDYSYLYFPVPYTGYMGQAVCVSSCPTTTPATGSTLACKTTALYENCNIRGGLSDMASDVALSTVTYSCTGGTCNHLYGYQTTGYLSRFCVPSLTAAATTLSDITSEMLNSSGADTLVQWVSDIQATWPVIAVSIGIAFVIGFVYMVLLRYCSGILTWLAILAFIVGTAILGWRFYQNAKDVETSTSATASEDTINSQKIIAYILWGIAAFTFLAVLCLYSRIKLAIGVIKAAADYVKDTPSVFLIPPVTVVILLVFYAFWGGAAVFLVTAGEATHTSGSAFGSFTYDTTLKRLLIYHLFGLLWINAFIIASTQFVLASSAAIWYFSQGTGQSTPGTIRLSVKRLFRYHFGSIAFGSLILAIVQFIRIVLAYMEAQAKKMSGKENKLVKCALGCLQCYVACFERFIKFLNKNAYIQIALTGKGFCGAAKDAFSLIINNPLRLGAVSAIGGIFVFFGKIFVASLTSLIAFLVITNWDTYSTKINSPFIPTLVVFIFAYAVGAVFMTIYGLAADTILACFIVDEQINKKKNAPPRHCPEALRSFLTNNRKN